MIPDIGGEGNDYFQVKERIQWTEEFVAWLSQAHNRDEKVEEANGDDEERNKGRSLSSLGDCKNTLRNSLHVTLLMAQLEY